MPKHGRLTFKGDKLFVKSKKKRITSAKEKAESFQSQDAAFAVPALSTKAPDPAAASQAPVVKVERGTGRITTSGTTVHGHDTMFMSSDNIKIGDALLVKHPSTLVDEMKLIKMVLSNISISLSSAFSSDLVSTTAFRFVRAPKKEESQEEKKRKEKERRAGEEDTAFGTYSSKGGSKVVYRVKKAGAYGGYEIVSEDANSDLTREELLNIRCGKKADRNCY